MKEGRTLFLYGFTGLAAIFVMEVFRLHNVLPGVLLALNPMAALLSLFEPEISREFFSSFAPGLQLWHIFVPVYAVLAAAAVLISIRFLRPVLRTRKAKEPPKPSADSSS